jgi:hypothetical protein
MARDAVPEGREAAQEGQVLVAPEPDRDDVVRSRQRRAEQEKEDLGQRVEHLGDLARVLQRGELVEQTRAGGLAHGCLRSWERPPTRTEPQRKLTSRSSVRPGRSRRGAL